jgi:hypothetical protein
MRYQCKLWMLMLVVLAVALPLAAYKEAVRLKRLGVEYEVRALAHALACFKADPNNPPPTWMPPPGPVQPQPQPRNPASDAYHAAMQAKYERAAKYPWLPVALDPPEPN